MQPMACRSSASHSTRHLPAKSMKRLRRMSYLRTLSGLDISARVTIPSHSMLGHCKAIVWQNRSVVSSTIRLMWIGMNLKSAMTTWSIRPISFQRFLMWITPRTSLVPTCRCTFLTPPGALIYTCDNSNIADDLPSSATSNDTGDLGSR